MGVEVKGDGGNDNKGMQDNGAQSVMEPKAATQRQGEHMCQKMTEESYARE